MSDPSPALPEPNAFRLSLLYAVVFVEIDIAMPFMPVWLNALGLDATVIGALLALPIAIRIVATAPLVGLIDRGIAAPRILLAGSLVLAGTYVLMPTGAALGWPVLALLIALIGVMAAPVLIADQQRAYLSAPVERRMFEIDFADGARLARTFETASAPAFVAETGR